MKHRPYLIILFTFWIGNLFSQNNNVVHQDSLSKQKTFDSLYVVLMDMLKTHIADSMYPRTVPFETSMKNIETIFGEQKTNMVMKNKIKEVKCAYNTAFVNHYKRVLGYYTSQSADDKSTRASTIEEFKNEEFYPVDCPKSGLNEMKKRFPSSAKTQSKNSSVQECANTPSLSKVINKLSINLGVPEDWTDETIIKIIFRNQCNWLVESYLGIPNLRDIMAEVIVKNKVTGDCHIRDVDIQQGGYILGQGFRGPVIMYYGKTGQSPCSCLIDKTTSKTPVKTK